MLDLLDRGLVDGWINGSYCQGKKLRVHAWYREDIILLNIV